MKQTILILACLLAMVAPSFAQNFAGDKIIGVYWVEQDGDKSKVRFSKLPCPHILSLSPTAASQAAINLSQGGRWSKSTRPPLGTQALVHSDTEASTLFLSMPFPRNQPFRTPGESCSRLAVELSSPPAPAPSQVLAL